MRFDKKIKPGAAWRDFFEARMSNTRERARKLLRKKEPFIWNATNLMQETRQRLVRLFAGYGARVHILYLEASYEEILERNRTRERQIPGNVLEQMIDKFEMPEPWEGYEVIWQDS